MVVGTPCVDRASVRGDHRVADDRQAGHLSRDVPLLPLARRVEEEVDQVVVGPPDEDSATVTGKGRLAGYGPVWPQSRRIGVVLTGKIEAERTLRHASTLLARATRQGGLVGGPGSG